MNTPYRLGYGHGLCGQQRFKFFTPAGCWEDVQYALGYEAGNLDRQLDIQRCSNDKRN